MFGREQVETAYAEQIGALADHLPSVPFLLGEFEFRSIWMVVDPSRLAITLRRKRRWMVTFRRSIATSFRERCGTTPLTMIKSMAISGTGKICRSIAAPQCVALAIYMTVAEPWLPSSVRMPKRAQGLRSRCRFHAPAAAFTYRHVLRSIEQPCFVQLHC